MRRCRGTHAHLLWYASPSHRTRNPRARSALASRATSFRGLPSTLLSIGRVILSPVSADGTRRNKAIRGGGPIGTRCPWKRRVVTRDCSSSRPTRSQMPQGVRYSCLTSSVWSVSHFMAGIVMSRSKSKLGPTRRTTPLPLSIIATVRLLLGRSVAVPITDRSTTLDFVYHQCDQRVASLIVNSEKGAAWFGSVSPSRLAPPSPDVGNYASIGRLQPPLSPHSTAPSPQPQLPNRRPRAGQVREFHLRVLARKDYPVGAGAKGRHHSVARAGGG